MAVKVTDLLGSQLGTIRYEPTAKRLRASIDGQVVVDTCDGLVVWEPGRIVPTYAVPAQDFSTELLPADARHSLMSTAYRPDDADLADYLVLDFAQFYWREEDEPIVGHPHDPFHRIDILRSSRHVRIELDGQRLAESTTPVLLFETLLPVRFTSQPTMSPPRCNPATPSPTAPTRAARRTSRYPMDAATSRGHIQTRSGKPNRSAVTSASSTSTSK